MRPFIATLLAFAVSPLLSSPAAAALVTYNPYYGSTTYRPAAVVWGDSLTRAAYGTYRLAGFRGEINGRSGRSVEALLTLVRERVRATSFPAKTVVIALGSNGGAGTFERWEYIAADRWMKAHGATKIVFVTPYRDGTWWDTAKVAQRAGWMRQIAAARTGTCVADWAAEAAAHPEYLTDGLHYNATPGKQEYVKLIMARVNGSCD